VERKRIDWRGVQGHRRKPGNRFRGYKYCEPCRRQSRHVQGLAYVAGCFRATGVRVQQGAATSEIQQRGAGQQRQGRLQMALGELA
jgi:hypothetical protein